ncbi:hypothetical protein [uncultured Chitinophaga sp.]|jgi:hypothetical protein|uniref:hypothetical protein n=1 Tax=uncultured Chitinophaga sp. TaxID=339340 RepID=UPI0026247B61|nr:hypothetical protein [uncultured Chitinophaga sp.]
MSAVNDGPYVFYQEDHILVKQIVVKSGNPSVTSSEFSPAQKEGIFRVGKEGRKERMV